MRKKLRTTIIGASVAALSGIGAVSFAYWSANSGSSQGTAGGGTGNTVETLGGITVAYKAFASAGESSLWPASGETQPTASTTLSVTEKLIPYDHAEGTDGHAVLAKKDADGKDITNVKYFMFKVINSVDDATDAGVTYKINGALANPGGAKLRYMVGAEAIKTAPSDLTGWTEMPSVATAISDADNNRFKGSNKFVTVAMEASGKAGVNTTWNISFTAEVGGGAAAANDYVINVNNDSTAKPSVKLEQVTPGTGEKIVYAAKNTVLAANDKLSFNIRYATISSLTAADGNDSAATISGTEVTVSKAGAYDIYIKQVSGAADGAWQVCVKMAEPVDGRVKVVASDKKVYLVGKFGNDVGFRSDYGRVMTDNGKTGAKKECSITVDLKAGDIFKIVDYIGYTEGSSNSVNWINYEQIGGAPTVISSTDGCFTDLGGNDHNIQVKANKGGTYTIYYKPNATDKKLWIEYKA